MDEFNNNLQPESTPQPQAAPEQPVYAEPQAAPEQPVYAAPQPEPQPQYQAPPQPQFTQPEQPQFNQQNAYQQPPYTAAQQPYGQQPYGQTPFTPPQGVPASPKDKLVAGLLGIFLGSLGIHKFYLGYTKPAVIMLLVSLLTLGIGATVMAVIGLIEGILYITKTDEEFYNTYVANEKEWF